MNRVDPSAGVPRMTATQVREVNERALRAAVVRAEKRLDEARRDLRLWLLSNGEEQNINKHNSQSV